MRLSRPRLLLRVALLLLGAGAMTWRARETWLAAGAAGLAAGEVLPLRRLALVELLLALVALGAALAAGLALRRRPARRKLGLVDPGPPGDQ